MNQTKMTTFLNTNNLFPWKQWLQMLVFCAVAILLWIVVFGASTGEVLILAFFVLVLGHAHVMVVWRRGPGPVRFFGTRMLPYKVVFALLLAVAIFGANFVYYYVFGGADLGRVILGGTAAIILTVGAAALGPYLRRPHSGDSGR